MKQNNKPKIFVSTFPFGKYDNLPIKKLLATKWEIKFNPLNRKLKPQELLELAAGFDGLIAGTENLTPYIHSNTNLKFISRVGIGLDSVPLNLCKKKKIKVSYTPDAVTDAVAELTIGLMIDTTRKISFCDSEIRNEKWTRPVGKRLEHSVIGIIGVGRVGKKLIKLISSFNPKKILINDIQNKKNFIFKNKKLNLEQVSKEKIYKNSDIISIHVPLYSKTKNLISEKEFLLMNKNTHLINTARGEIISEDDLFQALENNKIAGACIDVFSEEPYTGKLTKLKNIVLTEHIGSCSFDCRLKMELEASLEIIRFFKNEKLLSEVPKSEYKYQEEL